MGGNCSHSPRSTVMPVKLPRRKPCRKIAYPERRQADLTWREMGDDTLEIYECHRHTTDGVPVVYWHLGHKRKERKWD